MRDEHWNAAMRHLRVALVDLDYGLTEISASRCDGGAFGAKQAILANLAAQHDSLAELVRLLGQQAATSPDDGARWIANWWPDLSRQDGDRVGD